MKKSKVLSSCLSILLGIVLALGIFLYPGLTQQASATDWCEAPAGCAFLSCSLRENIKTCNFYKIDNAASCSSHPTCGTAPSGGGGGEFDPEGPPEQ